MPKQIKFAQNRKITYLYTTTGQKLAMLSTDNQTLTNKIDYIGNIVYEHDTLNYATLPEGKYTFAESNYEYFIKDHLGNVRAIIDQNATITEANKYYPFGMQIASTSSDNRYKYNGKELYEDFGLEWLDYGARFYDPQLATWHVQDPMAEKYFSLSPYNYVAGNPVIMVDPDGRIIRFGKNTSLSFKIKVLYTLSVNYLFSKEARGLIKDAMQSP